MSDEIPEEARPALFFHMFQKSQHEKYVKTMEDRHMAALAKFSYLLGELTPDQVQTLNEILNELRESPAMLLEMSGLIVGCFVFRDSRTVEGKDADAELSKLLQQEVKPEPTEPTELTEPTEQSKHVPIDNEYNFEFYNVTKNSDGTVVCDNCGTIYASFAARAELPPDGCKGCIHKTKWG